VKPGYFIVLDRLLGTGEHTYSSLFHLAADEAFADESSLAVRTTQPDAASLALIPLQCDGLTVRIVKGQEDPVQAGRPCMSVGSPRPQSTRSGGLARSSS